jgi:hypothetical protein
MVSMSVKARLSFHPAMRIRIREVGRRWQMQSRYRRAEDGWEGDKSWIRGKGAQGVWYGEEKGVI